MRSIIPVRHAFWLGQPIGGPSTAGCGLDDIVDVTSFHTDPEAQFGTVIAVKSSLIEPWRQ